MKRLLFIIAFVGLHGLLNAQDFNQITPDGDITTSNNKAKKDSKTFKNLTTMDGLKSFNDILIESQNNWLCSINRLIFRKDGV